MHPILNQYRKHISLVLRFLLGGGTATLAHWLSMWFFIANGMVPTLATTAGAIVGAVVNYFMQYHITFDSQKSHKNPIALYVVSVLFSTATNAIVFYLIFHTLINHVVISQLLTTAIVMVLNFTLYKKVVFRGS